MRTKRESRYLICPKCHNTILIAKHPHSLPQYLPNIYNPYHDPKSNLTKTKIITVKNINNPLNRSTGLLESIFNPLVDPYAIEKEFERFLKRIANREFTKLREDIAKKERERIGNVDYMSKSPVLERWIQVKKDNEGILNRKSVSNGNGFYHFDQDAYKNPYAGNSKDLIYRDIEKRVSAKLGSYHSGLINERSSFNYNRANEYIADMITLPKIMKYHYNTNLSKYQEYPNV